MSIELNHPALAHARALVRDGAVVRDERGDWSEAAPTADEENAFIEREGWTDAGEFSYPAETGPDSHVLVSCHCMELRQQPPTA